MDAHATPSSLSWASTDAAFSSSATSPSSAAFFTRRRTRRWSARGRSVPFLLDSYDSGELKKIFVVYTDMQNGMTLHARSTRLLPFHRAYFVHAGEREKASRCRSSFSRRSAAVLDNIMPSYLSGFIYSALIDSFCSEQNARMTAMDAANRNAEKLLGELSLQYNRVRQAAITQEITEISAGAKAQKKTRGRKRVSMKYGTIVQVSGPVVDVAFEAGDLPKIREALTVGQRG